MFENNLDLTPRLWRCCYCDALTTFGPACQDCYERCLLAMKQFVDSGAYTEWHGFNYRQRLYDTHLRQIAIENNAFVSSDRMAEITVRHAEIHGFAICPTCTAKGVPCDEHRTNRL